jgi:hypothetical protein
VRVPSTASAATHFDAVLSVCVCLCLSGSDCVCGLVVWLFRSSRVGGLELVSVCDMQQGFRGAFQCPWHPRPLHCLTPGGGGCLRLFCGCLTVVLHCHIRSARFVLGVLFSGHLLTCTLLTDVFLGRLSSAGLLQMLQPWVMCGCVCVRLVLARSIHWV